MFEEILEAVSQCAEQKVKLSKGAVLLLAVAAFLLGAFTGAFAVGLSSKRKLAAGCGCDDFDADEYVRNLSFDDE